MSRRAEVGEGSREYIAEDVSQGEGKKKLG
jgi:hypothetical protein